VGLILALMNRSRRQSARTVCTTTPRADTENPCTNMLKTLGRFYRWTTALNFAVLLVRAFESVELSQRRDCKQSGYQVRVNAIGDFAFLSDPAGVNSKVLVLPYNQSETSQLDKVLF
jgi:hypothetical protein